MQTAPSSTCAPKWRDNRNLPTFENAAAASVNPAWPRAVREQMAAVREALQAVGEAGPADVARRFRRARVDTVGPLLETLAASATPGLRPMAATPLEGPTALGENY